MHIYIYNYIFDFLGDIRTMTKTINFVYFPKFYLLKQHLLNCDFTCVFLVKVNYNFVLFIFRTTKIDYIYKKDDQD